jgi:TonB family protein
MSALSRFVVSATFHGHRHTRTWDPSDPMVVGKTDKGPIWVIEQTKSGEIRVRSLATQEGELNNAHSQILTAEQIKRGVEFKIKKKEEEIALEIRAIAQLHPRMYRHSSGDLSKGFSVYEVVGDYNTQMKPCKQGYVGTFASEEVFKVSVENNQAKISTLKPGFVLETNGKIQSLDSVKEVVLNADEFFKTTLRFGYTSWYFSDFTESRKDKVFDWAETSVDTREFRKMATSALLLLFLFFGGVALWPKSEKEEIIPPQVVKVLVQKVKKEKGKKLELPGEKKEQKEKALATSEEVAPVKPNELIIPKGVAGKKVNKETNQKISKVQNLYAGIMKGGLTKILNNNQLLNNAKIGQGAKINGDLSNLSTAMSKLNVDINAGGNTDSKVAGFGGNSNAGTKGPAAIGYSDGVKGVAMSGTGGSKIAFGTMDAEVEEGLTKDEVGKVIHAHMKEVRYCYESSMVRADRVDGKVLLDFTINAQGKVAKISDRRPASSSIDPQLGECIMRRLRTWQFPNPKGGVTVDVSYPFIFKTLGGG